MSTYSKNARPKETVIESYLTRKCKEKHIFITKNTGRRGIPDRLLIHYGLHIFIETKRPDEKTRESQRIIINRLRQHGALVFVADTQDKIDKVLELYDKKLSKKELNVKITEILKTCDYD